MEEYHPWEYRERVSCTSFVRESAEGSDSCEWDFLSAEEMRFPALTGTRNSLRSYRSAETEIGAAKYQRSWNAEPKRQQCDEGREWNGCWTAIAPEHEIQDEKDGENNARAASNAFTACRRTRRSYPGQATAVIRTFLFQFSPPNTARDRRLRYRHYGYAYFYTAVRPCNPPVCPKARSRRSHLNQSIGLEQRAFWMYLQVISAPRRAGERKPRQAKTRQRLREQRSLEKDDLPKVMQAMMVIWTPLPISTDKSMPFFGARKTSPWTLKTRW